MNTNITTPAIITSVPGIVPSESTKPKIENDFLGVGTFKHRILIAGANV